MYIFAKLTGAQRTTKDIQLISKDLHLPMFFPISRKLPSSPRETELTWEIDLEKKTAKCDVAEVGFYEYEAGGYGVSSVRLLDLRCGITEIKAARSAQQAIDQVG